MFLPLFQEKCLFTLGILKGFQTESAVFHGKQWFSGKDKIALQGARIRPEDTLRITLFSLISRILRFPPCMPPGKPILFSSCQEAVKYSVKQCISASLFLWFVDTLAESLTSGHCTHCSENRCFKRVPRVPI